MVEAVDTLAVLRGSPVEAEEGHLHFFVLFEMVEIEVGMAILE